eukprot:3931655-Rhodomonas_salina.1
MLTASRDVLSHRAGNARASVGTAALCLDLKHCRPWLTASFVKSHWIIDPSKECPQHLILLSSVPDQLLVQSLASQSERDTGTHPQARQSSCLSPCRNASKSESPEDSPCALNEKQNPKRHSAQLLGQTFLPSEEPWTYASTPDTRTALPCCCPA